VALLAVAAIRSRRLRWRVLCALLATAVPAWLPPRAQAPTPPRLVALDVGAGDALLLQGTSGTLLVDAGYAVSGGGVDLGRSTVVPALRAFGLRSLDVLVVTHADADHAGGAAAVLRRVEVGELWISANALDDPQLADLRRTAATRGTKIRVLHAPRRDRRIVHRVGDLELEVLWPPRRLRPRSRNGGSLVLRARIGDVHVLLTGDLDSRGERALLESGRRLSADVLKVAHHGSASASQSEFLEAVDPVIAVISAPCFRRGLPAPSVVARLERFGVAIGWTGRDGAVGVRLQRPLHLVPVARTARCRLPREH
jgi:competence protein ComEC